MRVTLPPRPSSADRLPSAAAITSTVRAALAVALDLRCRYRRDGLRPTLAKLGERVRPTARQEELVVLLKDLRQAPTPGVETPLRIEALDARHLPALHELNRKRCFTRADSRFAEDVAHGYRGFVGFLGNELIGYYWWVDWTDRPPHRDLSRLGLGIELAEGDVYGADFFILGEHRGGGVANDFLHKVETALRERCYRRLWGYVVAGNRPARWVYTLRGYEPVSTVTRAADR